MYTLSVFVRFTLVLRLVETSWLCVLKVLIIGSLPLQNERKIRHVSKAVLMQSIQYNYMSYAGLEQRLKMQQTYDYALQRRTLYESRLCFVH